MKNLKFYKKRWFSILLIFIFPFINFIYIHKGLSNLFIKIILNTILFLWTCFWLLFVIAFINPNTYNKHIPNKTISSIQSNSASHSIIVPMRHRRPIRYMKHTNHTRHTNQKKHIQSVNYNKPAQHTQQLHYNKPVQHTQALQNIQPVQQINNTSNQSSAPVLNYNMQSENSGNTYNNSHLHRHLSHIINKAKHRF